ncbi:class I SAM-dependent methyltransferase [Planctomycetota bacterium]|nr:class I SAM-dependent methyltransferase [Planctomycetota bacterium]
MKDKHLMANDGLYQYIRQANTREDGLLEELREKTEQLPEALMQISPDQGAFMHILAKTMGAKKALEVGTFTGYSAICVARALGEDGKLVCCDVSEEWTRIAKAYWEKAGLSDRIELHLRPAVETLDRLIKTGEQGTFDFAFIDADKVSYDAYYERALQLVRQGGLLLFDNCLRHGAVLDDIETLDPDGAAIVRLNEKLHKDERVDATLLGIADGIYMVRKR